MLQLLYITAGNYDDELKTGPNLINCYYNLLNAKTKLKPTLDKNYADDYLT